MKFAADITAEDKAAYLENIAEGFDPATAARDIGTTGTAMRRLRRVGGAHYDPAFAARFNALITSGERRQAQIEKIDEMVWGAAEDGQKWAIEKLMYTYHPDFEHLRHTNLRASLEVELVARAMPQLPRDMVEQIAAGQPIEQIEAPVLRALPKVE